MSHDSQPSHRSIERAFAADSVLVDLLNTALCRASSLFSDQIAQPDRFRTPEMIALLRAIIPQIHALDDVLNQYASVLQAKKENHLMRQIDSSTALPF